MEEKDGDSRQGGAGLNKDTMPQRPPKVQQQPNFSDCGIYLLQYIESFFRDPIKDYAASIRSLGSWFYQRDEVEGKEGHSPLADQDPSLPQNPGKESQILPS